MGLIRKSYTTWEKQGQRVPAGTRGAKRVARQAPKWYGRIKRGGRWVDVPLSTHKPTAEVMYAKLLTDAERQSVGLPAKHQPAAALVDLLDGFSSAQRANGVSAAHVQRTRTYCERILTDCGWTRPQDATAAALQRWVAGFLDADCRQKDADGRAAKNSPSNANHYLRGIKSFFAWLTLTGHLPADPLAHVSRVDARRDVRRPRRALEALELKRLLEVTGGSDRLRGGLAGPDRAALYAVAMATGLRRGELASLHPADFRLTDAPPHVVARSAYSKDKQRAHQELPPDLAAALAPWLQGKPAGKPVWPGAWKGHAAEMLKADLAAAGIPYSTRDGFADFHSLRHTYVTLLAQHNPPKVVQAMARHKTPTLTLSYYTHLRDNQRTQAAASLPISLHGACTDNVRNEPHSAAEGSQGAGSIRGRDATKNPGNPAESARKPG